MTNSLLSQLTLLVFSGNSQRMQKVLSLALLGFVVLGSPSAHAVGLFNTVRFLEQGHHLAGLEPELQMSDGSGAGMNIRYGYGLSDLSNVNLVLGSSGASRGFRMGGNATFDFFPDTSGQPGIGIAVQGMYYNLPVSGVVELQVIPYLHKTFDIQGDEIEPFLGIPLGFMFSDGKYSGSNAVHVGTLFKPFERFRFVAELALGISDAPSTFSGGVIYYF